MNRLFVFGDSLANNYFSPKNDLVNTFIHLASSDVESYVKENNYFGHWLDYMGEYYDVYSYGTPGVSNEEIIYQLGNLPKYKNGDRIIILLTTPERYRWFANSNPQNFVSGCGDIDKEYSEDSDRRLLKQQFVERDECWFNESTRLNEKRLFENLSNILSRYNPVISTWSYSTSKMLKNIQVMDIMQDENKYSSIYKESGGRYNDWHMGVNGNKEIFNFFKSKLEPSII